MATTVDLNAVLSHVKSKGVNLKKEQMAQLENLFHAADKLERKDGKLSQKELNYFVAHANKDWRVGDAISITKSAANKDVYKRNLTKRIKEIDTQIKILENSRKKLIVDSETNIGINGGAILGFVGGEVGMLALAAMSSESAFCCAAGILGGGIIGAAVGMVAGGIYCYNKYKNDKAAQNEDKKRELQKQL